MIKYKIITGQNGTLKFSYKNDDEALSRLDLLSWLIEFYKNIDSKIYLSEYTKCQIEYENLRHIFPYYKNFYFNHEFIIYPWNNQ